MIFICYPKCTTCQKARAWLDEHHITYNFRDIKLENPTYDELTAWHERSGLPLKRFFNTSGLLYKSMGLKDKLPQMSEDEMLKRLAADGMLVKRPLLVSDDFVLVGFKEAEWESCLKTQEMSPRRRPNPPLAALQWQRNQTKEGFPYDRTGFYS